MSAARLEAPWLGDPALRAVFAALGGDAVLVGGCVRNALLGRAVSDVDLATPLRPEAVVERLEAAKLRAVPTGFDHGTVTAVLDGRGFEITTFRADLETDGRHAVVRFSTDLAEDARRRDFTMNALYARPDGTVLDPLGGLSDLRAGRVRFIGDPHDRIREDYLRILRFFRFTAWYAAGETDPAGLAACAALAAGLEGLARERVGAEMRKLLAAPDPAPAVMAMSGAGVLGRILPSPAPDVPAILARLIGLERTAGAEPDWPRRLVALCPEARVLAERLRLSKAEERTLASIASALLAEAEPPALAAEAFGREIGRSALLIAHAREGVPLPDGFEAALARGASAKFPLRAADLLAAGWRPGPPLGQALALARRLWRASDFALDKAALMGQLVGKGQQD